MTLASRANEVSFNSIARGGMVSETYRLLEHWNLEESRASNFRRAAEENYLAVSSSSHLKDLLVALQRRLDPSGRERPLVLMAKAGVPLHVFRPCLLWHLTLDEFLLRDFLINWLFPAFERGQSRIVSRDLDLFLGGIGKRGGTVKTQWAEATKRRAASSLLKIASDFGLLSEGIVKRFEHFVLPEEALLYVLHGLAERHGSASAAVNSPDWRMFLLRPSELEQELLRLHQYKRVDFQVAGSMVQLTLPCASALQYAERMVA